MQVELDIFELEKIRAALRYQQKNGNNGHDKYEAQKNLRIKIQKYVIEAQEQR